MSLACDYYSDPTVCKNNSCIHHGFLFSTEKTKNLLFNGAKTVVGKIWTSEEGSGGHVETPPCQTLLRGQMLIGQDGKLLKSNPAQGEHESDMIVIPLPWTRHHFNGSP